MSAYQLFVRTASANPVTSVTLQSGWAVDAITELSDSGGLKSYRVVVSNPSITASPWMGSLQAFVNTTPNSKPITISLKENFDPAWSVADTSGTDTQITYLDKYIAPAPANTAPVFANPVISTPHSTVTTDGSAVVFQEGSPNFIGAAIAIDGEGQSVAYSITGGADAALFSIDALTGELQFVNAPDFESPSDENTDNVYSVTITATDSNGLSSSQPIAITVTDSAADNQPTGNNTMTTQTVIDTAAVSNALTNDLTLDSMASVVTALATAANNADIANKTELLNMINAMQPQIDAALEAADKLENYELGQVEAILQQLVTSDGFQQLLQTATVTVNGQAMTLESVLASVLNAPKVASWEFSRDTTGNITGVLANLTDGSTANMAVAKTTIDDGLPTEFDRYTFSQTDWAGKGFAAQFDIDLIARDIDFGGLFGLGSMGFGVDIKKQGNLLFDITGSAAGAAPTVTVPDANNDGQIGNTAPNIV